MFLRHFFSLRPLRYALVGGAVTVFDFLVLNGMLFVLARVEVSSTALARGVTFLLALIVAFVLHEKFTFGRRLRRQTGGRSYFLLVNVVLFFFSVLPFWIIDLLSTSRPDLVFLNVLNGVVIGASAVVRYLLYRYLVWSGS